MKYTKPVKARSYCPRKDTEYFTPSYNHCLVLKLDGHRASIGRNIAFTSSGKPLKNVQKIQELIDEGNLIDCEVVLNEAGLKHFNVKRSHSNLLSTAIAHHPEFLEVVAFDLLYFDGEFVGHWKYHNRFSVLEKLVKPDKGLKIEEHCRDEESIKKLIDLVHEVNHEGWIRKEMDFIIKPGSRASMVKRKLVEDVDVVIMDEYSDVPQYTVAPGHYGVVGYEGADISDVNENGRVKYPNGVISKPFALGHKTIMYGLHDPLTGELKVVGKSGITGPVEELKQHIGKVCVMESRGRGNDGAVIHKHAKEFRSDKDPKECVWCPLCKVDEQSPCKHIKSYMKKLG